MAAILDLKVKNRSNRQNNIIFGFFDPKNAKNDILDSIVGQTAEKLNFKMVDGGHFGFWAPTELAHPFQRCMGAKFFI